MQEERAWTQAEALRALAGLRRAAGLPEERFALPAFVGMVSDEVEALRGQGRSDEEIVAVIRESSGIELSAEELGRYYATPEKRGHGWGERDGEDGSV